jgi:alpha-L-fucosidase
MPDGRIEKRQTDILMGIGTWLDRYGESIYGTRGGPYRSASWLASTHKGNRIYVHLLTLPGTEVLLPALPGRSVKSARLLGAGEMRLKMEDGKLKIALPAKPDDANDTVIVLELDGPADTITPLDVPAMSLN